MKFSIRSVAAAATGLVLAMCVGSASATPVPTFTIDQSAIVGGASTQFTGDQFIGSSSELLTFNGTGNTGSGWLQISTLNLAGNPVTSFLGSYGLFVTFTLADTYVGGGTGPNTTGANNVVNMLDYQIWADPGRNNVFTAASVSGTTGTAASYTGGANDILLGFGSLINGVDGINALGGAFLNSTQTVALCTGNGTATVGGVPVSPALAANCKNGDGQAFFVDPVPFFSLAFTEFNNTSQGLTRSTNGTFIAINQASGSVDFNRVPEPGSMALFGLALAGLAVSVRRGKKSNRA